MKNKITPPINPNPEIEQVLTTAYEEVFTNIVNGTPEVVEVAVDRLAILGVLDYTMSDRVDPRADFIGRADKSWPALINERLDNYNEGLDIVPAILKVVRKEFLKIEPDKVKNMPILTGTKDFNSLPSDMSDIDYVKMILDRDIHPELSQSIGRSVIKVA